MSFDEALESLKKYTTTLNTREDEVAQKSKDDKDKAKNLTDRVFFAMKCQNVPSGIGKVSVQEFYSTV